MEWHKLVSNLLLRGRERILSIPEIKLFIKKPQLDMQLRHKCHNLSHKKVFKPNWLFSYHICTMKFCNHSYLSSQDYSKTKGIEQWYISVTSLWMGKFLGTQYVRASLILLYKRQGLGSLNTIIFHVIIS